MEKHNFVTIADLTKEKILYMIEMAEEFEKHPNRELLKGKVIATLFFEPSTRTRLSFDKTQGTLDNLNIYMVGDLKYGRTVHSLLMAMRHYIEGAAVYASEVAPIPIVNAGDGA